MDPQFKSEFFTWEEVIHTTTGARLDLDNTPPEDVYPAIRFTASKMDMVRALLGKPVSVSSWYRSQEVNAAVGSKAKRSQHILGEAVDFICPKFGSPLDVVKYLVKFKDRLDFDQLILEHTWVHISFKNESDGVIPACKNRNQILTLLADGSYSAGITDIQGKVIV